eukprot:gene2741-24486_t
MSFRCLKSCAEIVSPNSSTSSGFAPPIAIAQTILEENSRKERKASNGADGGFGGAIQYAEAADVEHDAATYGILLEVGADTSTSTTLPACAEYATGEKGGGRGRSKSGGGYGQDEASSPTLQLAEGSFVYNANADDPASMYASMDDDGGGGGVSVSA